MAFKSKPLGKIKEVSPGAMVKSPSKPSPASKSKAKVKAAFSEVYAKTPRSVVKTGKTGTAKQKMMTAIALSKARQAGARIPGVKTRKVTSY